MKLNGRAWKEAIPVLVMVIIGVLIAEAIKNKVEPVKNAIS